MSDSEARFAVIGAGLSGLRIASNLTMAKESFVLYEARDRVGGRVESVSLPSPTGAGPSTMLDLGAQWIGPGQTQALGLVEELGLHLSSAVSEGKAVWIVDKVRSLGKSSLPPMTPRALAQLVTLRAKTEAMLKWLPRDSPWNSSKAQAWDQVTVAKWIERTCSDPTVNAYATAFVNDNFAVEPEDISVLGALFNIRSAPSFRKILQAESFQVVEGTHEIAKRMSHRFADRIRLEDPVRKISQTPDGVTVTSDSGSMEFERVAVCLPPPIANSIEYAPGLPAGRAGLLASLHMSSTIKFHAVYQRPFWRSQGLSGQTVSNSDLVGFTYDTSARDSSGRGIIVGFVVAKRARQLESASEGQIASAIRESLGTLLGSAAENPDELFVRDWGREKFTGGCYSAYFPPGIWSRFGSSIAEPSGRIHWAGTETSTSWYGYMEGAVRSGDRVSAELIAIR